MSYVQAVEYLAREAGIPLPELTPRQRQVAETSEKLYEVMEMAARWFTHQLRRPSNGHAFDYITQRGISEESLHQFRLGFAPAERHGLQQFLASKGVSPKHMADAGLLSTPENGQPYDKFRDRIIFPIRDVSGRVIAFGGRLMSKEALGPKYLNSPETLLFNKSHVLYNLDLARKSAARMGQLVLAEGYMDVIALAQGGIPHAVAPLGTAITEHHLAMAWQMADEPVMCLDGDAAGLKAMQRALTLALPHLKPSKTLRFCLLPQGEDPDSFIKSKGATAMQEALTRAIPLVEMLWQAHVGGKELNTPEKRAAAKDELFAAIGQIRDKGVQQAYREEMNRRWWEAGRPAPQKKFTPSGPLKQAKPVSKLGGQLPPKLTSKQQALQLQRQILQLYLTFPALLAEDESEALLETLPLESEELNGFRQSLLDIIASGDIPHARESIPDRVDTTLRDRARQYQLQAEKEASFRLLLAKPADEQTFRAREALGVALERLQQIALLEEASSSMNRDAMGDHEQMAKAMELLAETQRQQQRNFFLKKEDSSS